ncbi:MAG: zinc ribbon domain-containing protein [Promethearchaeota archaeon]
MFCSNCGKEIIDSNQKFCQYCGNRIQSPSEAVSVQQTPVYTYSATTSHTFFEKGRPGPHSKKCLAFSIISIAMAAVTLEIGGSLRFFYVLGMPLPLFIMGVIINIVINIVGLILGILARLNGKKAVNLESDNAVEKVGSIFAIFGIIGNIILLIIGFIIMAIFLV